MGFSVLFVSIFCTRRMLIVWQFALRTEGHSAFKAVKHVLSNFVVAFTPIFRRKTICIQREIWFIPVVLRNSERWVPVENLRLDYVFLHEVFILRSNLLCHNLTEPQLELLINEEVCLTTLNLSSAAVFGTLDRECSHADGRSDVFLHAANAETMSTLEVSS